MSVSINGKTVDVEFPIALDKLLIDQGFTLEKIVVALNDTIIEKDALSSTQVVDNATIDVMTFVGGG